MDKTIRKCLREILGLSGNGATDFIHTAIDKGGLGFIEMLHNSYAQVANCLQMLGSTDPRIKFIAQNELIDRIKTRFSFPLFKEQVELKAKYLNRETDQHYTTFYI